MNDKDLDNWITGNYGQDQFPDKCPCDKCQEITDSDKLIETTSGNSICDTCADSYEQCAKCDCPIDNDQSWDNEYCDCCNESMADDYMNDQER